MTDKERDARIQAEAGQRLKTWILSRWETVTEAADDLGVPQPQLSTYFGGRTPGIPILVRLVAAGLNLNWYMSHRGPMDIGGYEGASLTPDRRLLRYASLLEEAGAIVSDVAGKLREGV